MSEPRKKKTRNPSPVVLAKRIARLPLAELNLLALALASVDDHVAAYLAGELTARADLLRAQRGPPPPPAEPGEPAPFL